MYNKMSQYVQLVIDLQHGSCFTVYNDINSDNCEAKEYYGFGALCFYEKLGRLYSCYTRLKLHVSSTCEHDVIVVEREVGTDIENVLITGVSTDIDDVFTFLYNICDSVTLLMVNESDCMITYKYADKVTFIDSNNVIYDKPLKECNYAIVTK